jgi:hypothetical protein
MPNYLNNEMARDWERRIGESLKGKVMGDVTLLWRERERERLVLLRNSMASPSCLNRVLYESEDIYTVSN